MPERRFPEDFLWGVATSGYQIEGAVDEGGRGESIWDRFCRTPGNILGGDNGDVACDHYHRYKEDVAIMAELGMAAYRFSVAWPRIVPDGTGAVNEAGLDFYDRLVDELLAHGITPYPTLYHWDLPQALEDSGGWPERATAEAFARYAGVVARRLGDRVESFATLNEPHVSSHAGYRTGVHAPGRTDSDAAVAAAHHLLLGHGLAVAEIREASPDAGVGIVINFDPRHPASDHILDIEAAAIANDQGNRWFLDPVMGLGYPVAGARAWGWPRDEVRPGDVELIAAPLDFLGVNYYHRNFVRSPHLPPLEESPARDEATDMGWEVYPEGLTEVLQFVHSRTGDLDLYVTENGAAFPDEDDPARDPKRVSYLERHLAAALDAIESGVPLRGYFAWSLLDNFEWNHGYSCRFGLVHVDFATQARTIRDSARFWSATARANRLG